MVTPLASGPSMAIPAKQELQSNVTKWIPVQEKTNFNAAFLNINNNVLQALEKSCLSIVEVNLFLHPVTGGKRSIVIAITILR